MSVIGIPVHTGSSPLYRVFYTLIPDLTKEPGQDTVYRYDQQRLEKICEVDDVTVSLGEMLGLITTGHPPDDSGYNITSPNTTQPVLWLMHAAL